VWKGAITLGFGLVLSGCIVAEGDAIGECTDAADNDRDGLFDCDDPDCFGSPDCSGVGNDDAGDDDVEDDDAADDDTAMPDDDTGPDDDDTGDDDGSGPTEFEGVVMIEGEYLDWGFTLACEGTATASADWVGGTLLGSGVCSGGFEWWEDVDAVLDFTCAISDSAVVGEMDMAFDGEYGEYLPDTLLDVSGTYDDDSDTFDLMLNTSVDDEVYFVEGVMSLTPVIGPGPLWTPAQ